MTAWIYGMFGAAVGLSISAKAPITPIIEPKIGHADRAGLAGCRAPGGALFCLGRVA
jgi:hypothetical protein